jgi:hypothetical protein
MTRTKDSEQEERELEGLAMNIVFQIGDALYEALPKDMAHDHFVDARQQTNDVAIDFAKKLIKRDRERYALSKQIERLEGLSDQSEWGDVTFDDGPKNARCSFIPAYKVVDEVRDLKAQLSKLMNEASK